MAMMPKRVKHRKSQRGRIKGNATRGNKVVFGEFGWQAMQGGWIKAATIEAGRIAAQQWAIGNFNNTSGQGDIIGEYLTDTHYRCIGIVDTLSDLKGNLR